MIDPEVMRVARLQVAAEMLAACGWTSSWDHQLAVRVARGDYRPVLTEPGDPAGEPAPCPRGRLHSPHYWTDGGHFKSCPGVHDEPKETPHAAAD